MLRSVNLLEGTLLLAPDGDAGTVENVLFDDEQWVVRYFVVRAGEGLGARHVLVSPYGIEPPGSSTREFRLTITREQLERAPRYDSTLPLTREREGEYLRFFAWPMYWGGGFGGLWGAGNYPGLLLAAPAPGDPTPDIGVGAEGEGEPEGEPEPEADDTSSRLHFAATFKGCTVVAADGTEVGEIDDFLVDDRTWALGYVAVYSPTWLGGRKVLVPAESFMRASPAEGRIDLPLPPESLRSAPEWEPLEPVTAAYEQRLRARYGRPRHEAEATEELHEESGAEVEEAAHA